MEPHDENGVLEQPPVSLEDKINKVALGEMNLLGTERTIIVFFNNGQVSNYATNIPRDKCIQMLSNKGYCRIDEIMAVEGFKDGLMGINMDNVNFWILREKSSIIQPPKPRVALTAI